MKNENQCEAKCVMKPNEGARCPSQGELLLVDDRMRALCHPHRHAVLAGTYEVEFFDAATSSERAAE